MENKNTEHEKVDKWCIFFRATRGTRSSSVLKAQLTSAPSGTSKRVVVYTSVASHSELPQTSPKQWCAQHKHSVKINLRKKNNNAVIQCVTSFTTNVKSC